MRSDRERGIPVLQEKKRWNDERNMQQTGKDENGPKQARARMKEKKALRSFPTKRWF
jgi:hypothetical protein